MSRKWNIERAGNHAMKCVTDPLVRRVGARAAVVIGDDTYLFSTSFRARKFASAWGIPGIWRIKR